MFELDLRTKNKKLNTILCLGAHCDDIEIGCGGTILRLIAENPELEIHWVVFSSNEVREKEATISAKQFLTGAVMQEILINTFRNGYFPYLGAEIKDYFEELKTKYSPDLIFTHYRYDLHQDHRLVSELTWNTFRDHLILEYEIAKYDGDLGTPNVYFPLAEQICNKKVHYLMDVFETQHARQWFTKETFYSLLRMRGIESNSSTGYAEGFYSRKMVI